MGRVEGKIALVTGAASGIGRESAIALAAEGAFVFVTDVDDAGGARTCGLISEAGDDAAYLRLDVADEGNWAAVIEAVSARKGALDILVNNAGICLLTPMLDLTLANWRRLMAINLDSVFLGSKAALPLMTRSGGGSIVNISSSAGITGVPLLTGYCASKGGVRLFTKALALECAQMKNRVRVNSIHPGGVVTPIWAKMSHDGELPDADASVIAADMAEKRAWTDSVTPVGFAGEPADIAAGVVFLASEESRFMTGAELIIDGGQSAG
jgi:NAD(P)-dependent dehydrogenase (short-subunit alcohol dehydrogenase family)